MTVNRNLAKKKVPMLNLNLYHEEIEILIHKRHVAILRFTATWLLPNTSCSMVNVSSFNIYRHDHDRDGRVYIYIRDDFKVVFIDILMAILLSAILQIT